MEEVVVTARRRSENIEKVPVSVTAFGPAQIAARGIVTEADLQTATPGLIVRAAETQTQISFSLRGQTIDPFSFSHTAVVPYIDEIEGNGTGPSSLFDLSSIQVLKGPQGTLFGRNTTGGAVLFETAVPQNEFSGFITADEGNYSYSEVKGAIDIPIVDDRVSLRISGDLYRRSGYVHDIYNDQDLGAIERNSVRATLVVTPTDSLKNTLVFEYDSTGGNNVGDEIWSVYPCGTPGLNTTEGCLYGPVLDKTVGLPGAWATYLAAHPKANPGGILAVYAQQQKMGPYTVDFHDPSFHHGHNWYLSNRTTYDIAPDLQIKNIIGVSNSDSTDSQEVNGSPYGIQIWIDPNSNQTNDINNTSAASDELQLLGKAFGDKLSYVGGIYISWDQTQTGYFEEFFDVSPITGPTGNTFNWRITDWSEAAYFQGTYDLSEATGIDGLSVVGGVRYTWEQLRLTQLRYSQFYGTAPETLDEDNPSWQVGLQYQVNPDLLVYLTHRGSWRAGGINGVVTPVPTLGSVGGNLFQPETAKDIEVGAKYRGNELGVPSQLNLAFYNQWVSNIQRALVIVDPATNNLSSLTANVPEAEITGVEMDTAIYPTDWLELGGQAAYTYARYTSPQAINFGVPTTYGPYSASSRWSGALYAQVALPVPEAFGEMTVRADFYAQTGFYFSDLENTSTPGTRLPGYGLLNLRYDWHNMFGSGFTLSGFCKNCLDKAYYVGGYAEGAAFGANGAIIGEPQMFAVEASYKF